MGEGGVEQVDGEARYYRVKSAIFDQIVTILSTALRPYTFSACANSPAMVRH